MLNCSPRLFCGAQPPFEVANTKFRESYVA
jgi:hypothetical protein